MSHRRSLLVLAVTCLAIATSCGSPVSVGGPASPGPTPSVTVPFEMPAVLTLAGSFGPEEIAFLDSQIAAFRALDPDVQIEIVDVRDANALPPDRASGLDILLVDDSRLPAYAEAGTVQPLDRYIAASGQPLSGLLSNALEAAQVGGQQFALPWMVDGGLLYYRQDLLDAYGYGAPASFDALRAIAVDIQSRKGLPFGFVWPGAARESLTQTTLEFVRAFGGEVLSEGTDVDWSSPETLQALDFMAELVASGVSPSDTAGFGDGQVLSAFVNGESVFMRYGTSALEAVEGADSPVTGRAGVALFPGSCLMVRGWALSTGSLHPDAAFRFMAFLIRSESQVRLARALGRAPALEAAYSDPQVLAERPAFGALLPALSASKLRPRSVAYAQVSQVIRDNVHAMLAGERDAATTAARIEAELGEIAR